MKNPMVGTVLKSYLLNNIVTMGRFSEQLLNLPINFASVVQIHLAGRWHL